eukprot:224037-Rhodomonas_salina.2
MSGVALTQYAVCRLRLLSQPGRVQGLQTLQGDVRACMRSTISGVHLASDAVAVRNTRIRTRTRTRTRTKRIRASLRSPSGCSRLFSDTDMPSSMDEIMIALTMPSTTT